MVARKLMVAPFPVGYVVKLRRVTGFTLIEMMIVLVIVGVILAFAVPGFSSLSLVTRLKSDTNEFVSGVHLGRSEAIKRNALVRMCVSSNGTTCAGSGDWRSGWIVTDPNDLVIKSVLAKPLGIEIFSLSSIHTMSFDPSGALVTSIAPSGTSVSPSIVRLCRKDPVGHQEKEISISAGGRPSVATTTNQVCPGS